MGRKEKYIRERNGGLSVEVKATVNGKRISVNGGTFKYANYVTPTACRKAAVEARNTILRQIETNTLIVDEPTVEDLYLRRTDYIALSKETRRKNDILFRTALDSYRNRKISTITVADIQRSLNQYGETHSTDAVKRLHALWRQIYRVCAIEELPIPDKSQAVTKYESKVVPKKRETRVTHEQFWQFIDALAEYGTDNPVTRHRTEVIYYALILQLYTGMRPQECYGMFREDIDLGQGIIHVRRRCGSTASESRQIITLKTADSCADVPIADDLRPYLEEMLSRYHTAPLLADYDGMPMDTKVTCSLINHVCKKNGIHFTQYMLRHLFAREMSKITDAKTLQTLMRHASADMSLYYSWSSDEELKKAVNDRHMN